MRSKPVQWLSAAALLLSCSMPGWAQPEPVGKEFQVNQAKDKRQLQPTAAFDASGHAVIVWASDLRGILGRVFDKKGPITPELSLVPNKNLPGIPAEGEVLVRKDPAVVALPNGEIVVFWTEERDHLSVDHFWESRKYLEQDVVGQRFSAAGAPLGQRFVVNTSGGFQRRPKAALRKEGIVVVWESGTGVKKSTAVRGRLLTRQGQPASNEVRIDSARTPEVFNLGVAANAAGEFAVTWESDDADGPGISARFYTKNGTPAGPEIVANTRTLGRQRRPSVAAGENGNFLLVWQGFLEDRFHGIYGQFFTPAGNRVGAELQISQGAGEVSVGPAVALLPSGDFAVAWMEWVGTLPLGLYAVGIDAKGHKLGDEVVVSQGRLYPQYRANVVASPSGELLATWEGLISRERAIAARRLEFH